MWYISYMYGQRRRQKAKSGQTQRILSTGIYLLSRATLFFHRKSGEIRERGARFNRRFSWPSESALIFHPAPPVGRWLKLRSAEVLRNFDMDGSNFDSNEARITKTWKSYQLQGQRSASKSDLPSRISASGHEKRKHDKVFFFGGLRESPLEGSLAYQ